MVNLWKDIPTGPKGEVPNVIYAVIEIPKGSRNKYEYNIEDGYFVLDRVLQSPFHYVADYGIIPQTWWPDGDALDILVMTEQPTFPGCISEVRPIGLINLIDENKRDDKILSALRYDPRFDEVKDIKDVPQHLLKEIAHFFSQYKVLEGKKVEVLGWDSAAAAKKTILDGIKFFKEKFGLE
ncbi:MAG: inorganic diphosphatase [Euryarchaeota archaeon]|nr:inorganic diphosphatase [Euryarchaeota archaeon]